MAPVYTISGGFRDDLHRIVRQEGSRTQGQQAREGYDGYIEPAPPIAIRASRCSATFAAAVDTPGDPATVDNVVPLDGGYSPVASADETITDVVNGGQTWLTPTRTATVGAPCVIIWNAGDQCWQLEPMSLFRFEMLQAKEDGGAATVRIDPTVEGDCGGETTVYDSQYLFSKMATTSGDTGAIGFAAYDSAADRYEILTMQNPVSFWGTLQADFPSVAPYVAVTYSAAVGGGYNVFQSNHGTTIDAYGHTGHHGYVYSGKTGDHVLCWWNVGLHRYDILVIEPNDNGWQTLDVVTRTSLTIDFNAKTFDHHYYTRQIKVPPFVTIGDEVEH